MEIFLDGMKVPVNPKEIILAQNQTINVVEVMNGGEIPMPGHSQLQRIQFESFVPGLQDGNYKPDSVGSSSFIDSLREAKTDNKQIRVIISGLFGDSMRSGNVNQEYLIENFEITAKHIDDIYYSISLLEYRELKPRMIGQAQLSEIEEEEGRSETTPEQAEDSPARNHTVVRGDTLWGIARKYYGDGSKWKQIYEANSEEIEDPHWIYPGEEFLVP